MSTPVFFDRLAKMDLNKLIEKYEDAGAEVKLKELHWHESNRKYYDEYWGYLTLSDIEVI